MNEKTPYQHGHADGLAGKSPLRTLPAPNAPWSEKLYDRGWKAGDAARAIERKLKDSQP